MGEKYHLKFLSDLDNKSILINILNTMSKYDWNYNKLKLGKYSFWKNGPIWKFGDSEEIIEYSIDKGGNIHKLSGIIEKISPFYSQSIIYNKSVNDRITSAITMIVESVNMRWKEISIAFELDDLLAYKENLEKISREVKEIFVDLVMKLNPHYAIAAIEMKGLVADPEYLEIQEAILGSFNYFSFDCSDHDKINEIAIKYETYTYENKGIFIYKEKNIGNYD